MANNIVLTDTIEVWRVNFNTLNGQVTVAENNIVTLTTNLAANSAALVANATTLNTTVSNLAANATTLNTAVANLAANATTLNTTVSNLAANATTLNTTVSNLAANATTLNATVANVASINTAVASINVAIANIDAFTNSISAGFADGSAANAGIRFAANNNTGFFRPATDTIGVTAGGVERARILPTGQVVIGGNTPAANSSGQSVTLAGPVHTTSSLVANGTVTFVGELRSATTGGAVANTISVDVASNTLTLGSSHSTVRVRTSNTDRITVDSSGNIAVNGGGNFTGLTSGTAIAAPSLSVDGVSNGFGIHFNARWNGSQYVSKTNNTGFAIENSGSNIVFRLLTGQTGAVTAYTTATNVLTVSATQLHTTRNLVTTGTLTAGNAAVNDLSVAGNLTVSGTTTYLNTQTLNVGDNIITLNADYAGSAPTENAGIEVNRGTLPAVSCRWNETSDRWEFTNNGTNFFPLLPVAGTGADNGLDADLLDGQHGSFYQNADNLNAGIVPSARMFGNYDNVTAGYAQTLIGGTITGNYTVNQGITVRFNHANQFDGNDGSIVTGIHGDGLNIIGVQTVAAQGRRIRLHGSVLTGTSGTYWNSENDGSGSGLDADLLDGNDSSFFRNASNLNAGTVPTGQLSGTYNINVSGNAATVSSISSGQVTGALEYTPMNSSRDVGVSTGISKSGTLNAGNLSLSFDQSYGDGRYVVKSGTTWTGIMESSTGTDWSFIINNRYVQNAYGKNGVYGTGSISSYYDANIRTQLLEYWTGFDRGGSVQSAIGLVYPSSGTAYAWHSLNDGAGSGLDADLLDGNDSSAFFNSSNQNAGTLPTNRLSGTYNINISGQSNSTANVADWQVHNFAIGRYVNTWWTSADGWKRFQWFNTAATVIEGGATSQWVTEFKTQDGDVTRWLMEGAGNFYAAGNVTAYWSDKRLKKNINKIDDWKTILDGVSGVRYQWNEHGQRLLHKDDSVELGMIAQEVFEVLPEAAPIQELQYEMVDGVKKTLRSDLGVDVTEDDPLRTVRLEKFIPILIEAVKDISSENEELKKKNKELEDRLAIIEKKLGL